MKFLSNPNLPEESVCAVLVDYRTAPEIIASLEKLGIIVYKSCKVDKLDEIRMRTCRHEYPSYRQKYICVRAKHI